MRVHTTRRILARCACTYIENAYGATADPAFGRDLVLPFWLSDFNRFVLHFGQLTAGPCGVGNFHPVLAALAENFPISCHSVPSSAGLHLPCQKGKKVGGHQVCRN